MTENKSFNMPGFAAQTQPSVMLKLAALQALASLVFALCLWGFFDVREAVSALYGGLIAALMSGFMAIRLFSSGKVSQMFEQTPQQALIRFYVSVILKVLFTLALILVFLVWVKISPAPFVMAYLLAAVVVNWLALRLIY